MRNLVSIRNIDDIRPIDGADAIETAVIGGWNVVVKKNEFAPGDYVFYFEIDSVLPNTVPEFEFLMKRSCRDIYTENGIITGHRLRTVKLRGQISQGLVLPIPSDVEIVSSNDIRINDKHYTSDDDFAWYYGVFKYEPVIPVALSGMMKGNFPSFIHKTDQERVQNCKKDLIVWTEHDYTFEATEKLDGTSATFYLNDGVFGVCSRNIDLIETEGNTYWMIARKNNIEDIIKSYGKNLAIQGEIIGASIQGNKYNLGTQKLYVFDIFDIDEQRYFTSTERIDFCNRYNLNHVPVLQLNFELPTSNAMEYLLEYANGTSALNETAREGIVFKCHENTEVSFKAISNTWLLKNE